MTSNSYGWGHSVYGGFDYQIQASAAPDLRPYERLLLEAIDFVQPDDFLTANRAVPVTLTLTNRGIATPGQITLRLPDGVTVADVIGGQVDDAGRPIWDEAKAMLKAYHRYTEDEILSFTAWLVFPAGGSYSLEIDVYTGVDSEYLLYGTIELLARLPAMVTVGDVAADFAPYSSDSAYKQAVRLFELAQADLVNGELISAIRFLIKTAEELSDIGETESDELRRQVARLIRRTEQQIQ